MTPFVLARYLTWRFLLSCGAVAAALAAFVFIINLAELLNRSAGKDEMTFGMILAMSLFKLPLTMNKLFPFIALFGAMWMFARLARYHELEAILAPVELAIHHVGRCAEDAELNGVLGPSAKIVFDALASDLHHHGVRIDSRVRKDSPDDALLRYRCMIHPVCAVKPLNHTRGALREEGRS